MKMADGQQNLLVCTLARAFAITSVIQPYMLRFVDVVHVNGPKDQNGVSIDFLGYKSTDRNLIRLMKLFYRTFLH